MFEFGKTLGVFINIGIAVLIVWVQFFIPDVGIRNFGELNFFEKIIFVWGLTGAFVLWLWMSSNLLTNKNVSGKIVWGICLLIFNWIAAVFYFWTVYLKNNNRIPNK